MGRNIHKKILEQENAINELEKQKLAEANNFLKEKDDKIEDLKKTRDTVLKSLAQDKKTDRNNAQSLKEKNNEEKAQANAFLKKEFEKIAGVAIFIVLTLASLKEIIHFRNEIDPQPILGELDFQFDWIKETLSFPFVWIQRHMVNKIRQAYKNLPKLESPPVEVKEITDYKESQKIIPLVVSRHEYEEENFFFRKPVRVSATAKTHESFIAHEKTTKSPHTKHETPEIRTAKQRLKMYKKKLGSHQQKALKQEREKGEVSLRTQRAIKNNLAWVEHWEDILNGGSGTRK